MRLLSVSPMGDECQLTAEECIKYFEYVLSLYSNSLNNVFALVVDNAPANRAIAIRANIPFVGCAYHRFNLAARDILQHHSDVISKVHAITLKLRTLLLSAKLLKLTPLNPYLRNETRWSSTCFMLERYQKLREFLPNFQSHKIDMLLLSLVEDRGLIRCVCDYKIWTLSQERCRKKD